MSLIIHRLNFSEGNNGKRVDKVSLLEQEWRPYAGKPTTLLTQKKVWSGTADDLFVLVCLAREKSGKEPSKSTSKKESTDE